MKTLLGAASVACLPLLFASCLASAQDTVTSSGAKPTEHVLGTVTAVDPVIHAITVKEDKSGIEQTILLADAKTLIKVAPGAKDLKNATRFTADQLEAGDRVDIRGFKSAGDASKIAARSVVLMSARELQQVHQVQAAEWQHSTPGVVTAVDPASGRITIRQRTPAGPKSLIVETSPQTEFTRYSPQNPSAPAPSQVADVQPGDQVRVIGDLSSDGSTLAARRLYSGAFRTLNGTIISIAPDGKQLEIRDLASKKPVTVLLTENSSVRKLPPELAAGLARRVNPGAPASGGPGNGAPNGQAMRPSENTAVGHAPGGPGGMRGPRNGDVSQMIERLPKIALTDLKPGDAVVLSGVPTGAGSRDLMATNVIAGVEPILSAAPARQGGQALGGDWGLGEITAPQ